ncbi:MAG TPA: cytochrome c [Candidatus Limnocylindria bacterium]
MRRETTDLIGSGLLLAALIVATLGALAPTEGASASVPTTTTAAASDPFARGRMLFMTKGCVSCHTKTGVTGQAAGFGPTGVAPDLTGLAQRAGAREPGMSAQDYVRESLRTPSAFKVPEYASATFGMPDLGLSDAEIDALSAFLLGTP